MSHFATMALTICKRLGFQNFVKIGGGGSSHQILTGRTERPETALEIMNHYRGMLRCLQVLILLHGPQ